MTEALCQYRYEILHQADLLCTADQIQAALERVAEKINKTLATVNPLVLCVMRGGLVFTGQLLTKLNFPLDLDYVHVTRYGGEQQGGGLRWIVPPNEMVQGRVVLIADDILDEGHTLAALKQRVLALGATHCYSAVLVDKLHGRIKPIQADFVGLNLPDRFVFGYGMDIEGAWRNLPAIYALKQSIPES